MAQLEYQINIRNAKNGLIVEVGCQTFVFIDNNIEEFFGDLRELILNGTTKTLYKKYMGADKERCVPTPANSAIGEAQCEARY